MAAERYLTQAGSLISRYYQGGLLGEEDRSHDYYAVVVSGRCQWGVESEIQVSKRTHLG